MRHPKKIIILMIMLLFFIYLYIKNPVEGPICPCMFNIVTGLYCPGCGMTRAVHSLLHFKFYQAVRYNILIILIPPLLIIYLFMDYVGKCELKKVVMIIMLSIAIFYGIIRNLPSFDILRPVTIYSYI